MIQIPDFKGRLSPIAMRLDGMILTVVLPDSTQLDALDAAAAA